MPKFKFLIIPVVLLIPFGMPPVLAGNCLSSIMTVETLLVRLDDANYHVDSDNFGGSLFAKTDIPSAKRHLLQAKANLQEGLEMNCELEIVKAMKRLGARG